MKQVLIGGAVVLALVGLLIARSILAFAREESRVEAFLPALPGFFQAEARATPGPDSYLRGRVVTVDGKARRVDPLTYPLLPVELRASRPSEVGTVAFLRYEWTLVGKYRNVKSGKITGDAYRCVATLRLVDLAGPTLLEDRTFVGEDPVKGQTRKGDFYSQQPMFEIVRHLGGLPRR